MRKLTKEEVKRFFSYIKKDPITKCCEWQGCITKDYVNKKGHLKKGGYGLFTVDGKLYLAHKISYFIQHNDYPDNTLHCDHLCRNRKCVNPFHIQVISVRENTTRGLSSALKENKASQYTGVVWNKFHNKWQASIAVQGLVGRSTCSKVNLGYYETEVQASDAYQLALTRLDLIENGMTTRECSDRLRAIPLKEKYSQYQGVSYNKEESKWTSTICVNKYVGYPLTLTLGRFDTEEEAYLERLGKIGYIPLLTKGMTKEECYKILEVEKFQRTSKYPGVSFDTSRNQYFVQIFLSCENENKTVFISKGKDEEDAYKILQLCKSKLNLLSPEMTAEQIRITLLGEKQKDTSKFTSSYKGVFKKDNRWATSLNVNLSDGVNKTCPLGSFDTQEEAYEANCYAKEKLPLITENMTWEDIKALLRLKPEKKVKYDRPGVSKIENRFETRFPVTKFVGYRMDVRLGSSSSLEDAYAKYDYANSQVHLLEPNMPRAECNKILKLSA